MDREAIKHAAEVLEAVHQALYGDGIRGTLTSQSVELGTRKRYWRLCRDAAKRLRDLLASLRGS